MSSVDTTDELVIGGAPTRYRGAFWRLYASEMRLLLRRRRNLILLGALAWCFAMAGFADHLKLSSAMGALIAGVMISTFPYTLDVVAKVTSLRDFFVTLFFVGLGMIIPMPTVSVVLWTLFVCFVIIISRLITVFPVLYAMRQGYRVSLLPAINLCQMSELESLLCSQKANELFQL